MRVIFLSILFLCVNRAAYGRNVQAPLKTYHTEVNSDFEKYPDSLGVVVNSWMQTDKHLRRHSELLIETILPNAFTSFTMPELTPNCSRDMGIFKRGFAATKFWAYQMVDASGIIPVGIMKGTVSSLGDYNSCLNVTVPNSFFGKYCLVDFEIPLPEKSYFRDWKQKLYKEFDLTNNDTVTNAFLSWGHRLYMLHPRISICIPSTCTIQDAQHLAKAAMEYTGLQIKTNVKSCETRHDNPEITFIDLVMASLLYSVFLMIFVATAVDFIQRVISDISYRKEEGLSWFLFFSLFINAERLVKKDDNPDSIRVFYGIRVITMLWLIFFHITFVDHVEAYGGLKRYFDLSATFFGQLSVSGILGVDTFFFMSAVLLSYQIVKTADQNMSIGLLIAKRYLRVTIPHVLMIALTCVLPFMNSGPLYKEIVGKEAQNCRERWWMNLLYINNFQPFSEICMGNSWYLGADMQLFILGLLVIVPLRKKPRAAIICIVALFFCGEIGTFISHLLYNLPPTVLSIDSQKEYIDDLLQKSYFLPHFHLPNYCIGMLVGYFLALGKNVRVPMGVSMGLWSASLSIMFSIVFGTYVWNKGTEFPGMLPSIIFGCTHRVLWSLSLAWITIACQSDQEGIIAKFLGAEKFVLLNRMTFMIYLTNFTVKYLYIGTTSSAIVYSTPALMNMFMGFISATVLAAFILTLFFEAPFMNLEKALIVMLKGKKPEKGK